MARTPGWRVDEPGVDDCGYAGWEWEEAEEGESDGEDGAGEEDDETVGEWLVDVGRW